MKLTATITLEIYPDQNDWLDLETMTKDDLVSYAIEETVDYITQLTYNNELSEIIKVEEIKND